MKPIRIQRKRTRGWKMPENTVSVTRPGKWGNPIKLVAGQMYIDASYRRKHLDPWVWINPGDIEDVLYLYKKLWDGTEFENPDLQYWSDKFKSYDLRELVGKNIACFCKETAPCHGDFLIKRASQQI